MTRQVKQEFLEKTGEWTQAPRRAGGPLKDRRRQAKVISKHGASMADYGREHAGSGDKSTWPGTAKRPARRS